MFLSLFEPSFLTSLRRLPAQKDSQLQFLIDVPGVGLGHLVTRRRNRQAFSECCFQIESMRILFRLLDVSSKPADHAAGKLLSVRP